jgi:murein DD-endopeptidase MepM/ murein hydrolase activator NlpD
MIGLPARLAALALLALSGIAAAADGLALRGEWRQGSAIFGAAPAGTRVWFNGRALAVSPAGEFVFGLDRDAPTEAELKIQLPGTELPELHRYAVARRTYDIQRLEGLPPGMVSPPAAVQARIRREQALVGAARRRESAHTDFAGTFIWPCIGRISGVFGSQRILNGEAKQPHYGVDVAVPTGTPVRAPAGGIVSLAHPDMYYTGGTLMIDHGHGLSSAFLHLSKLLVKEGERVEQGAVIALAGATGRATGAHLDWRVSWIDARVDAALLPGPMPAPPSAR